MAPRTNDPFEEARARLATFDPISVAAGAAALALLPDNGNRLERLGYLAALAGETNPVSTTRISRGQLGELVNSGPLARHASDRDDPFENVLVEEVAFSGGPRRLGSGLAENAVYVLRMLIPSNTLSVLDLEAISADTRADLVATMNAGLALSDSVLRTAGPTRHTLPGSDNGTLTIPSTARLAELSAAVTFTDDQLDGLIGPDGRLALEPLIRDVGQRASPADWITNGQGDRWPLLRAGNAVVLAQPYGIAGALCHHVLATAVAEAGEAAVALAFGHAVDEDVRRSLRRLGVDSTITVPRTEELAMTVLSAELDAGLTVCCAVLTDTMKGFATNTMYGRYTASAANAAAQRAFSDSATTADDREVLGLLVAQSAGRSSASVIDRFEPSNLTTMILNAADLEIFAVAEAGDGLALWKFATESHALHEATQVMCFSKLDLYAQYRANDRSLRSLHDASMVTISPGSGANIRGEAKAGLDRHAAFYVDGTVREVQRDSADSSDRTIYRVRDVREPRILRHVGGAPVDLWVRGPEAEISEGIFHLVETVAYWLDELAPEIASELGSLATKIPCFTVDIDVADSDYWFAGGEQPDRDGIGEYRLTPLGVDIRLGPMIRRLLPTPDNRGERLLVGMLLDLLDESLKARELTGIGEARKRAVGNHVAPEGIKKHLLMLPGTGNELMEDADGPARLVQEFDLTVVRRLLGRELMNRFGFDAGTRISSDQRREVVREGVAYLLDAVCADLATLSPDGLLESLMHASERIIAESERDRAFLPARAATYPSSVSNERLRHQSASINQASVCCRFLIECVAAQPPKGTESWSVRRYDHLMALCAEMLDWAYLADAFEYGMSDNNLLINSEGELRLVELDRYELGRSSFHDQYIDAQRRAADDVFSLRFGSSNQAKPSDVLERVDPAMRAEAGVSLSELRELAHAANAYARARETEVVVADRDEALRELASLLGWETDVVESGLRYLTMGAREKLLEPANGTYADVIPSRFSRRWSLNRRPIVERGVQLAWGRRQVLAALRVIVTQVHTGRFQVLAETDELRDVVSAIGSESGYAFEKSVADIVKTHVDAVQTSVKTIGGQRIARTNGETLGDVDVLAGDRANKLVYAIECKDLAGALTPTEVANELRDHFDATSGTSSSKHRERTDWLTSRMTAVLEKLGLDPNPSGWRVVGVFVTSTAAMAPHIKDTDFDIVSAHDLPTWLDDQRRAAKRRRKQGRGGRRRK